VGKVLLVEVGTNEISKRDISKIAQRIRKAFFLDTKSVETNLGFVLARHKIIVCWSSNNDFINSFVINDGISTIYLPFRGQTTASNNYRTAKALGHFFLHANIDQSEPMFFARNGDSRQRMEATWFAAELLMPELELQRTEEELRHDYYAIATIFGVEASAMKTRLESLGLRLI